MSELAGLFTTKVIKSHVKLHVKSDAQKVNRGSTVISQQRKITGLFFFEFWGLRFFGSLFLSFGGLRVFWSLFLRS